MRSVSSLTENSINPVDSINLITLKGKKFLSLSTIFIFVFAISAQSSFAAGAGGGSASNPAPAATPTPTPTPTPSATPSATPSPSVSASTPAATPKPAAAKTINDAKVLLQNKNFSEATLVLTELLKTNSKDADVLNLLGFSARNQGDLKSSAKFYSEALKINPKHLGALEYQGELFLKQRQPAKAKSNLNKLKQLCGVNCEEYKDLQKAILAYK